MMWPESVPIRVKYGGGASCVVDESLMYWCAFDADQRQTKLFEFNPHSEPHRQFTYISSLATPRDEFVLLSA
jgi:hypothetical protein